MLAKDNTDPEVDILNKDDKDSEEVAVSDRVVDAGT